MDSAAPMLREETPDSQPFVTHYHCLDARPPHPSGAVDRSHHREQLCVGARRAAGDMGGAAYAVAAGRRSDSDRTLQASYSSDRP